MTQRQSATVLAFLAAVYAAALVLFAPQLDFVFGESDFGWLTGAAAGFVVASPAYLAIWAVLGRQRSTVRLPLTAWLCAVFFLAAIYGEVRFFGGGDADIVVMTLFAWITAYLAFLFLLCGLRVVRGWRLDRMEPEPTAAIVGRKRQFTIRTLLVWTSAAAALFAGLRWLAPYGVYDAEQLPVLLEGIFFDASQIGLIFALAGLPVVSVAFVVLADGRRTIWRGALVATTALGIAGGAAATQRIWPDEGVDMRLLTFGIESGVLLAGVAAALITRVCGYRLVRGQRKIEPPASCAPLEGSRLSRRFAFALTPLVTASLLLACYAPQRLKSWQSADERQRWDSLGWYADFDDEGRITHLTSIRECDIEGTMQLSDQLLHLTSLQLSMPSQCDAVLAALPPLAKLETLILDDASDANLTYLDRFPNLESLTLSGPNLTDSGLSNLGGLSKLKSLDVVDTALRLEQPPHLPQLETLNLQKTAVGDAGLSHIGRFPNLRSLNLCRTNVTDRGLASLCALKSLSELNLQLTDVSDAGLGSLSHLSQLKSLDLQLTAVSETGLVELRKALPEIDIKVGANDALIETTIFAISTITTGFGKMVDQRGPQVTMLKRLHARGNYPAHDEDGDSKPMTVTDKGLALLSGQTDMEDLDLRESAVTDAGLKSLGKLTSLKRLDLRGTRVTERGCEQLARTMPGCEILR